jgi:threonine aldolase
MIRFNCDYSEGAHPRVMEKLLETNLVQTPGYGEDQYCEAAAERIRTMCGREDIAIHFMVGGTQTNLTVLAAALRPHQGVVACDTGHINVHESGAIEATGHKVLSLPNRDGKLEAEAIRAFCKSHF